MRVANLSDRLVVIDGGRGAEIAYDVEKNSEGRFSCSPQAVYEEWEAFREWAATAGWTDGSPVAVEELGSPAPAPRQVLAIGLNYRAHATESGFEVPVGEPPVFTKFPSCITGPHTIVTLPAAGHTDWEVELVAVMGRRAEHVAVQDALSYVAGYATGQDLSERVLQLAAAPPQFSLGKSLPGFGPIGPWLVTLDEFADPNDLALCCDINGERVQDSRTSLLIFSVPVLIAKLSATMPLLPGDVIFTGTPAGVGMGRDPQRWLAVGDVLTSHIEGIGELRQQFI